MGNQGGLLVSDEPPLFQRSRLSAATIPKAGRPNGPVTEGHPAGCGPIPEVQSIELTSLKLPFNSDADSFTGYFAQ